MFLIYVQIPVHRSLQEELGIHSPSFYTLYASLGFLGWQRKEGEKRGGEGREGESKEGKRKRIEREGKREKSVLCFCKYKVRIFTQIIKIG